MAVHGDGGGTPSASLAESGTCRPHDGMAVQENRGGTKRITSCTIAAPTTATGVYFAPYSTHDLHTDLTRYYFALDYADCPVGPPSSLRPSRRPPHAPAHPSHRRGLLGCPPHASGLSPYRHGHSLLPVHSDGPLATDSPSPPAPPPSLPSLLVRLPRVPPPRSGRHILPTLLPLPASALPAAPPHPRASFPRPGRRPRLARRRAVRQPPRGGRSRHRPSQRRPSRPPHEPCLCLWPRHLRAQHLWPSRGPSTGYGPTACPPHLR